VIYHGPINGDFECIQSTRTLKRDYAQCGCAFFQTDDLQNEDGYELHCMSCSCTYMYVQYIMYSSQLMKELCVDAIREHASVNYTSVVKIKART
jgi:hypothetical protein